MNKLVLSGILKYTFTSHLIFILWLQLIYTFFLSINTCYFNQHNSSQLFFKSELLLHTFCIIKYIKWMKTFICFWMINLNFVIIFIDNIIFCSYLLFHYVYFLVWKIFYFYNFCCKNKFLHRLMKSLCMAHCGYYF